MPSRHPQSPDEPSSATGRLLWSPLFILALSLAGVLAYYSIFSTFKTWDDEGYMMISIKFFNRGYPLYDDVYSQYGPFYLFVNWLIFEIGALPITTDTIRFVTMSFWLAVALMSAVVVWRMTRAMLLAFLTLVLVAIHLNIGDEPGHPQGICTLIGVVVLLLGTCHGPERTHWIWAGLGLCAGMLIMIKINLGIFLLVVFALLLLSAGRNGFERALGILSVVATLLMPAILMRAHLGESWFLNYCLTVTFSLVPALLILWRRGPTLLVQPGMLVAGLTFSITVLLICVITCLMGTRPMSLLHGVLLQHLGFPTMFHIAVPFDQSSLVLTALGFLLYQRIEPLGGAEPSLAARRWLPWLKLTVGLAIFGLAALQKPSWMLRHALPFLWLALLPQAEEERTSECYFARLLLVLTTLVQSLQAYPVGGTQVITATFPMILIAAVCLRDAFAEAAMIQIPASSSRAAAAMICILAIGWLSYLAMQRYDTYQELTPLDLPGARRLRLPAKEAMAYQRMTALLREHADTFLTMPGFNSFYFWSEIDPPTHLNATHWMTLFDSARQQRIADEFARHPRACVIRNQHYLDFWLRGQEIDALPLVRMLNDDFRTIDRAGEFEFRVRKE